MSDIIKYIMDSDEKVNRSSPKEDSGVIVKQIHLTEETPNSKSEETLSDDQKGKKKSPNIIEITKNFKVEDRTTLWQQRIEEKIKEQRDSKKGKELEGCTFKPVLIAEKPKPNEEDVDLATKKSVQKYVDKQKALRKTKEQKKIEATMQPGYGT